MKHRETFPLDCRINAAISFILSARLRVTGSTPVITTDIVSLYKSEKRGSDKWNGNGQSAFQFVVQFPRDG